MPRLAVIIAIIWLAITIYSLVDVSMIDRGRVRGVPKGLWIVIILILPLVGAVMWFALGRGRGSANTSRVIAPDDDPDFLRGLKFPPSEDGDSPRG